MAKRTDIKKVLIIGSGPIVIGQAAEFDYAGTQACLALKEEGYEVVLVNSNPATIMTDTTIADKVYMEPLTLEYIAKILRFERPDAIVPGIGGQTGLNLAMQLEKKGVLKECGVELLGTSSESIERAEDRELFKEMCQSIGEPVIPSEITYSLEEAKAAAKRIGYPVVLRPAFTLGGTGGGFANNEEELMEIGVNAFKLSPVHQVLVEKSVKGYKEIEFEVMRDSNDHAITICGMENVDPVGVHTGDSIVVAPILSLNDHDLKMLNDSAIKIIRELKIEGGCNVQFALNPDLQRVLPDRGQPPRLPLLGSGLQGQRLPHRPRDGQDRHGHGAGGDPRGGRHRGHRAEPGLYRGQVPALPLRQVHRRAQHPGHPDEGHGRGHGHRLHPGGVLPQIRPLPGDRRMPFPPGQVRRHDRRGAADYISDSATTASSP